jgi:hypothetical protein
MVLSCHFVFCYAKNFPDNTYMQKIAKPSILIKLTIATTNSFSVFLYGSKVSLFRFYKYTRTVAITLTLQYIMFIQATATQVHISYAHLTGG